MMSSIAKIFGSSPVKPLEEHMKKVDSCVSQLLPFFAAVIANDWDTAEDVHKVIVKLENEADTIKRQLRLHLPNSLFMPLARSDLLELLTFQDRLANTSQDIAGVVIGRRMQLPPVMSDEFIVFLSNCVKASAEASSAIYELDELLETGFSSPEVKLVEQKIVNLYHTERDTDTMQVNLRLKIYQLEQNLNPIDVMFLYQVITWVGDLANCAQDVGDRLQILLAR